MFCSRVTSNVITNLHRTFILKWFIGLENYFSNNAIMDFFLLLPRKISLFQLFRQQQLSFSEASLPLFFAIVFKIKRERESERAITVEFAVVGRAIEKRSLISKYRANTIMQQRNRERQTFSERQRKVQFCYCNIGEITNLIVH